MPAAAPARPFDRLLTLAGDAGGKGIDVLERGAPLHRGARSFERPSPAGAPWRGGSGCPASEEFDMTRQKHLKQLVRARMAKTGERYATARRHIIRETATDNGKSSAGPHLTGNVPATTALRVLLTAAGVRAPHTNEPFTEPMLFGIAGGVGVGMFSFLYEKANFASFYVAGRNDWANDVRYLQRAAPPLGPRAVCTE